MNITEIQDFVRVQLLSTTKSTPSSGTRLSSEPPGRCRAVTCFPSLRGELKLNLNTAKNSGPGHQKGKNGVSGDGDHQRQPRRQLERSPTAVFQLDTVVGPMSDNAEVKKPSAHLASMQPCGSSCTDRIQLL